MVEIIVCKVGIDWGMSYTRILGQDICEQLQEYLQCSNFLTLTKILTLTIIIIVFSSLCIVVTSYK
jgi:hypothetical protein